MSEHDGLVRPLFDAIDRMDADAFVSHLTEDARFVFGNNPEVRGLAAVRAAVQGFFDLLGGLSHRIDAVAQGPGLIALAGMVTYRRKDGSAVSIPFADFLTLRDGQVSDYRIYMDPAPLFAPPST